MLFLFSLDLPTPLHHHLLDVLVELLLLPFQELPDPLLLLFGLLLLRHLCPIHSLVQQTLLLLQRTVPYRQLFFLVHSVLLLLLTEHLLSQ